MALLDFLNKRSGDEKAEMTFIDHLEELRWHIIRAVIAVLIGAIVVFIFINNVVDDILFAPAKPGFVTAQWFCTIGRKIGLGEGLCFGNVEVKFLETTMTGQFVSSFTVSFICGFIIAFPYIFWEFWKFVKPALSPVEIKKQEVLFSGCQFFSLQGGVRIFCTNTVYGEFLFYLQTE